MRSETKVVCAILIAVVALGEGRHRSLSSVIESMWVKATMPVIVEKIVQVASEPNYGNGIEGLVVKHAKLEGVPVAFAKSIFIQESRLDVSNMSVNIAQKYITKGKSYKAGPERWKFTAWGAAQILPVFTMDICGYKDFREIYGKENLEKNIACGMKRLRHDFDKTNPKASLYARWASVAVSWYGDDVDGFKDSVMARLPELSLEMEG